jgi:aldehyde dehydrogenase (NAD+)
MKAHLIAGAWVEGTQAFETRNPSRTDEAVDAYAQGGATEISAAVEAARTASPRWAAAAPQQRFNVLDAVGTEILARQAELGRLLAREEGKTLPEALGEVARAGQIFKFFAGEALRLSGLRVDSVRPGVEVTTRLEPLGVVGLVTPWNFPIAIPAWKTAPALAFGNAVVLKPSEVAPGCAWALAEILSRAGLPEGAFNLVLGGAEAGKALAEHPLVDGISFTGSVATGRTVAAACAARLARCQLEMGGKNPLVVLDDADLDVAVNAAAQGAFYSTGQRCTASSRLIVTGGIHDRFVAAMVERMKTLKVGDALDEATHIGPAVDARQFRKDLDYIALAKAEGGRLAWGGEAVEGPGHFVAPTLFTETDNAWRFNREEAFGPLAAVIRARDFDEALAVANDTDFGLVAGICTTNLKHAAAFQRHAQAGMVMVNLPTAGVDYHVPFGGRKGSSCGPREQGAAAREFYTVTKTCYTMP